MPSNRFIEIIFTDLKVEPQDKVKFNKIIKNNNYKFPFYNND